MIFKFDYDSQEEINIRNIKTQFNNFYKFMDKINVHMKYYFILSQNIRLRGPYVYEKICEKNNIRLIHILLITNKDKPNDI